jgi:anti-anti-sigma factor
MGYLRTDYNQETVFKLNGRLDKSTLSEFSTLANQLLDEHRAAITLDMSDLQLIDKNGVRVIADLIKKGQSQHSNVQIVGIKDQPK